MSTPQMRAPSKLLEATLSTAPERHHNEDSRAPVSQLPSIFLRVVACRPALCETPRSTRGEARVARTSRQLRFAHR